MFILTSFDFLLLLNKSRAKSGILKNILSALTLVISDISVKTLSGCHNLIFIIEIYLFN